MDVVELVEGLLFIVESLVFEVNESDESVGVSIED